MKKLSRLIGVACFGVLVLPLLFSEGQDKKPPETLPGAEIERLVDELGSGAFATREQAYKRLRETPHALIPLRNKLKDPGLDLETRRRVEKLVGEITRDRFRRLLREEAAKKGDARIDLLTDLLLANRHHVAVDDWKLTVGIVSAIAEKVSLGKVMRRVPWADWDVTKFGEAIGGRVDVWHLSLGRIIADRVVMEDGRVLESRPPSSSIAVVSECMDDYTAAICMDNILLINADRTDGKRMGGFTDLLSDSFIYCDGDFECRGEPGGSIVLASGRIKSKRVAFSVIIEGLRKSSAVRVFSVGDVGLKLAGDEAPLRVESVDPKSAAARSRLKKGDLIKGYATSADMERAVRKAFAASAELPLCVQRGNREEKIALSFAD